jgi:hypothetical protein
MAAIQAAITIGYFCAAAGGVITLALAYDAMRLKRIRFTLPTAVVMLLVHPAWTVSAIRGDCGHFKIEASTFFTVIFFCLMIFQYVVSKRKEV